MAAAAGQVVQCWRAQMVSGQQEHMALADKVAFSALLDTAEQVLQEDPLTSQHLQQLAQATVVAANSAGGLETARQYTAFCQDLYPQLPSFQTPTGRPLDFKRLIINAVQTEYESFVTSSTDIAPGSATGQAVFISALHSIGWITRRLVHGCIQGVLSVPALSNAHIAFTATLLKGSGAELEAAEIAEVQAQSGQHHGRAPTIDIYMTRLNRLSQISHLSSQSLSLIQELMLQRANNWLPLTEEELKAHQGGTELPYP